MLGEVNVGGTTPDCSLNDEPTGVELRLVESARALVVRFGAGARFGCGRLADRDEVTAA
ncbi:hypothetical protein ACFVDQ_04295 [Streptomyces sp. NPDC057684]|uniref:hypothetical protein n=1 Tax=unclassified Streptomyces TaxID=2593676 RepID=UPI0035E14000